MRKGITVILLLVLSLGLTQCVMPDNAASAVVWETTVPTAVPTTAVTAPSDPTPSDTAPTASTPPTTEATEAPTTETAPTTLPQISTTPTDIAEENEVPSETASTEPTEELVWISRTGSKYHTKSTCSNMKDPSQITKEAAESRGYTPCKRCC